MSLSAQDPRFSQYFSSPLTINPANTGNFDGIGRLAFNFRNQWQGIGEPYLTGTVSYDTEFLKKAAGNGNKFSIGFMGLYDHTAGGLFTSNYLTTSVGYHLFLDEDQLHKLSIGVQATLANRRLDYTKITFSDQFTSFGYDLSLPSNQNIQFSSISYVDWSTGLMYKKQGEINSFYIGASGYHLNKPNESFLKNGKSKLPIRMTLHAGWSALVGYQGTLITSGNFMVQGKSKDISLGMAYGHQLDGPSNDIIFYLGSWYRHQDAIIPYLGISTNNIQLGLTYDINISGLNLAKTKNGSFELSLIYNFQDKSEIKRYIPWY